MIAARAKDRPRCIGCRWRYDGKEGGLCRACERRREEKRARREAALSNK